MSLKWDHLTIEWPIVACYRDRLIGHTGIGQVATLVSQLGHSSVPKRVKRRPLAFDSDFNHRKSKAACIYYSSVHKPQYSLMQSCLTYSQLGSNIICQQVAYWSFNPSQSPWGPLRELEVTEGHYSYSEQWERTVIVTNGLPRVHSTTSNACTEKYPG